VILGVARKRTESRVRSDGCKPPQPSERPLGRQGFPANSSLPDRCSVDRRFVRPGVSATVEERFILFDNGREFRSVPTSIQNGVDTLAWLGTGYRISKSPQPVHSCGPQTAHGTYLLSAENIIGRDTAVADSLFIRQDVSLTGDWNGTLYEKIGPVSVETAALGTFSVNPDCSFTATLKVPEFFSDAIVMKGVFFNQGKEFYLLAFDVLSLPPEQQDIRFSFAYGKQMGQ